MRILLLAVATVSLSGCSWMGYTTNGYNTNHSNGGSYHKGAQYSSTHHSNSKWSMSGSLGTEILVGGTAISGDSTPFANPVRVNNVSMKDAYKKGLRGELGAQYKLNEKQDLTLTGFYQTAKGKDVTIGRTATGTATGNLSNYKAYGAEAGFRHKLNQTRLPLVKSVQPYIEGRIGVAQVSDISVQNLQVDGGAAAADMAFYDGRLTPTVSGLLGFEKNLGRRASWGVETGVRYMGDLNGNNQDTAGTFLSGANQSGARWSVPIQLRGRYRF